MAYIQGYFTIKNPKKYIGKLPVIFRSSWEHTFFSVLDNDPAVLQWASESIKIPYLHPITGKLANYIPDLLIVYLNKDMKQVAEIIEIKPLKETLDEFAKSKKDLLALAINKAKWEAAKAYCATNGLLFRVMTEEQLFGSRKRTKKINPPNRRKRTKK